jgi:hypothetical protein
MDGDTRIDARGIAQLIGSAVLFAAVWAFVYVVFLRTGLNIFGVVAIGLGFAVVGVVVQFFSWSRLGGRASVVMTNGWIHSRHIPVTVPREVWWPLLKTREEAATRQWRMLVPVGIWVFIGLLHFVAPTSNNDHGLWVVSLAVWLGLGAWVLYYNLRWLPVIRTLMFTAGGNETVE